LFLLSPEKKGRGGEILAALSSFVAAPGFEREEKKRKKGGESVYLCVTGRKGGEGSVPSGFVPSRCGKDVVPLARPKRPVRESPPQT